jgi:hypothetical protein
MNPLRWTIGSRRAAAAVVRRAEARKSRCGSICRAALVRELGHPEN